MSWLRFTTTVSLLASALTLAVAQAQVPGLPDHGQDPRRNPAPTVPGMSPQPLAQAMPVVPDTVEILLDRPMAFGVSPCGWEVGVALGAGGVGRDASPRPQWVLYAAFLRKRSLVQDPRLLCEQSDFWNRQGWIDRPR